MKKRAKKAKTIAFDPSPEGLIAAAYASRDSAERHAILFALREVWGLWYPTRPLTLKLPRLTK